MVSPAARVCLIITGWICVVVGAVALLVPVLPTTPFLLIAAACFAESSPRFYNWLLNHRLFGPFIRNYREKGGITRKQKAVALATFWPAILISGFFMPVGIGGRLILFVSAVGVTTYLVSMKSVE